MVDIDDHAPLGSRPSPSARRVADQEGRGRAGDRGDDDPFEAAPPTTPEGSVSSRQKQVLLVEDDRDVREAVGEALRAEGYAVTFAENGQQALEGLRTTTSLPAAIILDLNMPVMDGWQFRAAQKEEPRLNAIPVIAVSADRSAPAVAISCQAYIQKPFDLAALVRTIERVLFESERQQMSVRLEQAERLASLGRIAAGVGHEVNNPLLFSMLNLQQALAQVRTMYLREGGVGAGGDRDGDREGHGGDGAEQPSAPEPAAPAVSRPAGPPPPSPLGAALAGVLEMLGDCEIGLERIRLTVGNLQRLSRRGLTARATIDVRAVMEEAISMAWNQIRHRARLTRSFPTGEPLVWGNSSTLGQVFLNVLVNAAQSIPEGQADRHEIFVGIEVAETEVTIEVRDTGSGIPPEILPHVFDPFFTTKSVGSGTGLGLAISRQAVHDLGGRMELTSRVATPPVPAGGQAAGVDDRSAVPGTSCRIALPRAGALPRLSTPEPTGQAPAATRAAGRLLVIDDEEAIGRILGRALAEKHRVTTVLRAVDAFALFEAGERFDLVLCDLLMPSVSGPEVYTTVVRRWPEIVPSLVFMTGGAFTPSTAEFVAKGLAPLLQKPFRVADVLALLEPRLRA